jgi:hypothetical protein
MLASHKHAYNFPPEIEVPSEGVMANVLFRLLLGSSPVSLTASSLSQPKKKHEAIRLTIEFEGSNGEDMQNAVNTAHGNSSDLTITLSVGDLWHSTIRVVFQVWYLRFWTEAWRKTSGKKQRTL